MTDQPPIRPRPGLVSLRPYQPRPDEPGITLRLDEAVTATDASGFTVLVNGDEAEITGTSLGTGSATDHTLTLSSTVAFPVTSD